MTSEALIFVTRGKVYYALHREKPDSGGQPPGWPPLFNALKMVRTSDANRYQDLGIRVTEVILERFVSEPVKVEFERQVLVIVLSDEIDLFRPELIKIAFRITGSVSVL